ncbi:MAG: rRNA maturation RNase YbeY [Anaerolineae bacterium]|nr:rRNA maturation RNase YbeY [Anaerolineae bacterium]
MVQIEAAAADDVDAADLARAILATLRAEGRAEGEVTLVVTDDDAVAELNRTYLGVDGPTDVLSFPTQGPPLEAVGAETAFVAAPEMADYLGDIVIALPYTRRQAAALGRSLRDELRLLAVHGTLHLLGYDHAEPDEEAAMWERQDKILNSLNG